MTPVNRQQWTGRRKKKPGHELNRRTVIILIACGCLVLFSLGQLIHAAVQRQASEKADEEMRTLYHTEEAAVSPTPAPSATPEEELSPRPTEEPTEEPASPTPEATGTPAPTLVPRLEEQAYPGNPGRTVSARFRTLREQNRDIIGWLTIGSMVDEAVAQRDNEYYMDHNIARQPDASGAIFLDAIVSLETRPYALILYGHNMKTGARFGSLRNFENRSFYHKYPFITFDTLYEDGRYVVFSVGTVSTEESDKHYLDFYALNSRRVDERGQALDVLQAVSVYSSTVDVALDDQILLLVTCVDRDADRRVVAARRIREGEKQNDLKALVEKSSKK